MRGAAVLTLLMAGCQVVFPLEDDPPAPAEQIVEQRTTFTRSASTTNQLIFDGEPEIQPGDLLIAMIQARSLDDITMTTMSTGWMLINQGEASGCSNGTSFHLWLLRTIVTTETTYNFTFNMQDDMAALVTAYTKAGDARQMDFKLLGEIPALETTFAADEIAPGSIVWFGGGAQQPWGDPNAPLETDPLGSVQNLSAYQLEVPTGSVPEVVLPIPEGFCADVAQIKVEP